MDLSNQEGINQARAALGKEPEVHRTKPKTFYTREVTNTMKRIRAVIPGGPDQVKEEKRRRVNYLWDDDNFDRSKYEALASTKAKGGN